jgi:hypothetical protein
MTESTKDRIADAAIAHYRAKQRRGDAFRDHSIPDSDIHAMDDEIERLELELHAAIRAYCLEFA